MGNRVVLFILMISLSFVCSFHNALQAQNHAHITSVVFIDDAISVDESTGDGIYLETLLPSNHLYVTISYAKSYVPQDSVYLICKKVLDTLPLNACCPFSLVRKKTIAKYCVGIVDDGKYLFPAEFYMNDWDNEYKKCAKLLRKDFKFYYYNTKKAKYYHLKCPQIQMLIKTPLTEKIKFKESFCN